MTIEKIIQAIEIDEIETVEEIISDSYELGGNSAQMIMIAFD